MFAYGLLVLAAYRSYVSREAAWDLLALVLAGGAVACVYQWSHDVLTKRSALTAVMGMLMAIVAALIVFLR